MRLLQCSASCAACCRACECGGLQSPAQLRLQSVLEGSCRLRLQVPLPSLGKDSLDCRTDCFALSVGLP